MIPKVREQGKQKDLKVREFQTMRDGSIVCKVMSCTDGRTYWIDSDLLDIELLEGLDI